MDVWNLQMENKIDWLIDWLDQSGHGSQIIDDLFKLVGRHLYVLSARVYGMEMLNNKLSFN